MMAADIQAANIVAVWIALAPQCRTRISPPWP
jgi:hypothetical protein